VLVTTAKRTAERDAFEIRLRAEHRAGQLLKEREKAKGAAEPDTKRGTTPSQRERASTLGDMGISYTQSSRWQKLAEVPEKQFDDARGGPEMLTWHHRGGPPQTFPI
jgi:hypothetical protein